MFLLFFITSVSCCIPTQQVEEGPISTSTTSTTSTTTIPPVLSCLDSTWILFDRGSYSWCMKMVEKLIYVSEALALCQELDPSAVISGLQNKAEGSTLVSLAASEGISTGVNLIIGAKRTSTCLLQPLDSTCNTLNSFYWTDGYTTGTDGFNWVPGQPDDSGYLTGNGQNYVLFLIGSGLMDDGNEVKRRGGVLCGMKADYY
ncbi:unnamed protein product [Caenorhabditis angaria]|uniref:C-type lectin domain-containing protein n=1 Tax=Caenorhabditis angaria TaxID=860376 RepID=A0A9P1N4D3_9PELO|nr:unnamed protein product [Caenorhabditis angaria]